jgi:hypothetical protein
VFELARSRKETIGPFQVRRFSRARLIASLSGET